MKLSLIFSDIEAGSGNRTDDFIDEKLLSKTIRTHNTESKKYPSDLILNGDTFDFMKCPYKGRFPKHITAAISVAKIESIAKAHPHFFNSLRQWLRISKNNRVIFVHGNHDYDLVFEEVQQRIKSLLSTDRKLHSRIIFAGWEFTDGLLHVEHGSQLDEFFRVDPDKFIFHSPKHMIKDPFLKIPWGYNALYDHFIQIKEQYPLLERILPRKHVFQFMPIHVKNKMILGTFLYMLKAFFYIQIRHWGDPVQAFSFFDFKRYMKNFFNNKYDVDFIENAKLKLKKHHAQVLAVGHNHSSSIHALDETNLILNTGPWRDEYFLQEDKYIAYPKEKSYAYVLQSEGKVEKAELKLVASIQKPLDVRKIFTR